MNETNQAITQAYNYDAFVSEKFERWLTFGDSPPLGKPGPDFLLTTLQGEVVKLSEIWRQSSYTIIEFGSFT